MRGICGLTFAVAVLLCSLPATLTATMNPVLVGALAGGNPQAVAAQGSYAFCASGAALSIFDLSDPTKPRLVGFCDTPGVTLSLAVAGRYAYVGYGAGETVGLVIIDIADPANPGQVSSLEVEGYPPFYPSGVAVAGNLLLIAGSYGGLGMLDISDPNHPREIGSFPTASETAENVAAVGNYAFVTGDLGLSIVDITQPSAPVEVALQPTYGRAVGIAIQGNLAYVTTRHRGGTLEGGLLILDISEPWAPVEVGFSSTCKTPAGVTVSGSYAYVADDEQGLRVFDVSHPDSPNQLGVHDTPGHCLGSAILGESLCVADDYGGLRVMDIHDPAAPVEVGRADPPASAWAIVAEGDVAYLADSFAGLHLVDISDPAAPVTASVVSAAGLAADVAVSGRYAYVADGHGALRIFDVSRPKAPVEVGSYVTAYYASSVAVSGDYAYVGDQLGRLRVIGISDPEKPVEVATWEIPGEPGVPLDISVSGDKVCVTTLAGLAVFSGSPPSPPTAVSTLPLPGCRGVDVVGKLAYLAVEEMGLVVVDISDPLAPRFLAVCQPTGTAIAVTVHGSYAYCGAVVDGAYGLRVAGLTDPAAPVWVGGIQTVGWASGIAVSGDSIDVSADGWGLLDFRLPLTFSDLPLDYWALDAVERCRAAEIVAGYTDGTYRPDLTVCRDQMAVYISRALAGGDAHVPTAPYAVSFRDVPLDHWAYKYIGYAAANNIVSGYPDSTYRPYEPLDRGQMAAFIARAIATPTDRPNLNSYAPPSTATFLDVPTSFWSFKFVEYIKSMGVTQGYPDGNYHPEYACTRDQMAVYVARAFKLPM